MNIIQSFLVSLLQIDEPALRTAILHRVWHGRFQHSLLPLIDAFLRGDHDISDELWKFSVSLDVPHQLLFDAFRLQMAINLYPSHQRKVG